MVEVVEDEASEAIEAKETERSGGKPPSVSIWSLVKDFLRASIKIKKRLGRAPGVSRKITKIFVTFFILRKDAWNLYVIMPLCHLNLSKIDPCLLAF